MDLGSNHISIQEMDQSFRWSRCADGVEDLIRTLLKTFPRWATGSSRITFFRGDGYVVKVPFEIRGLNQCLDEVDLYSGKPERELAVCLAKDGVKVAECWMEKIGDIDVLIMEEVRPLTYEEVSRYERMAEYEWIGRCDCSQVGWNKQGEIVAYDM